MPLSVDHDRVERVHIRSPHVESARARVAAAAAALELAPQPYLESILLIRRLSVSWKLAGNVRQAADRWARSVADVAANSVRPVDLRIDPGADVVLFRSCGEALACLALDGVERRNAWWWENLGVTPAEFARVWLERPESIPEALATLADARVLPRVLRHVNADEGRRWVAALVSRFGLSALVMPTASTPAVRVVTAVDMDTAVALGGPAPPWATWGEDLDPDLPPTVELAAGLGLGLRRATSAVRSRAFAEAVQGWSGCRPSDDVQLPDGRSGGHLAASDPAALASAPVALPVIPSRAADAAAVPPEIAVDARRAPRPTTEPIPPARGADALAAVPSAEPGGSSTVGDRAGLPPHASSPHGPGPADEAAAEGGAGPTHPPVPMPEAPVGPTGRMGAWPVGGEPGQGPEPVPPTIRTELGGSFYLINVLLSLEIYGDFTQPLHPDPGVSIWDCLAALTEAVAGPVADPLWGLLAALGGRRRVAEGETPDAFVSAGAEATIDPAWPYPEPLETQIGKRTWTGVHGWLALVEAGVRGRLARAIGVPPEVWVRQHATVRVGSTRMYVDYLLDTHPIEVRLAALDRDPGWIGAAGHDVRFRYTT